VDGGEDPVKRERKIGAATLLALTFRGPAWAADAPPDGAKLYQSNCQSCHGRNGKALPFYARKGAPDLNDPEWQKERTDEHVRTAIAEGSEGTVMKAFKKTLSPEQIDALVKHVRTLGAAPAK
jgi:mono/diheme cytochrome c family protein